jgi:hypothetical protein
MSSMFDIEEVDLWDAMKDGMNDVQLRELEAVKSAFNLSTAAHVGDARFYLALSPDMRYDEYLKTGNTLTKALLGFYVQTPIKQRNKACTKFIEAQSGALTVAEGRPIDFDKIKSDTALRTRFTTHLEAILATHLKNLSGMGFPLEAYLIKQSN